MSLILREFTHVKGFNVTSLKGVTGLYIFRDNLGKVEYVGSCRDDFKKRLNSHYYHPSQKLDDSIRYMNVIITDPNLDLVLHVLEHLFIWYFKPERNETLWFFSKARSEKEVKDIAKKNNLYINKSIHRFLLSFNSTLIEREWDENYQFVKIGKIKPLAIDNEKCEDTLNCKCFRCLVKRSVVTDRASRCKA